MKKIFLLLLPAVFLATLFLSGCREKAVDAEMETPTPTIESTPTKEPVDIEKSLTMDELSDVSGWDWQEEYGYFIVDNYRWGFLTIWYDPFEQHYSLEHPYSSLSDEHIANGSKVYPINRVYTNEYGNTFIPFRFTDLKHPDYEDDGDGVYWLLYKNFNGTEFLEYCSD